MPNGHAKGTRDRVAVVALITDPALARAVDEWAGARGLTVAYPGQLGEAVSPSEAEIVVIQANGQDEALLSEIEALCDPRRGVVVVMDDPTPQTVRRLFRAGVADVLSRPVPDHDLGAALDAARVPSGMGAHGKILCVVKTAGGVGGTTVAVNAARELLHSHAERVAVADLDVQFGGLAVALDLDPRMTVNDAIRAGTRADGTLLKSVMTRHKSGLEVLPASAGMTPLDVIDEAFLTRLCDFFRTSYDYTIIELPISWCHWFGALFDEADLLLPVVEPSVRSADGARRVAQGLEDLASERPSLFVVANKVDKKTVGDRLQRLGDILGTPVGASLREDEKAVGTAGDLGRALRDAAPGSNAAQDAAVLAAALAARLSGVGKAHRPKSGSLVGKLFRR